MIDTSHKPTSVYWRGRTYYRTGRYREYYAINKRGQKIHGGRLHCDIWEFYNSCEIPKGYVIHHFDLNPFNSDISNLWIMRIREHHVLHNLIQTAQDPRMMDKCRSSPKQYFWHRSEAGKKYFSEHSKKNWRLDRFPSKRNRKPN